MAQLVTEIAAPSGNSLVLSGEALTCAGTARRACGFAAQASMADFEAPFGLAQMPGRCDLLAGREHGKVLQPQIDADVLGAWSRFGKRHLALDGNVVGAGL